MILATSFLLRTLRPLALRPLLRLLPTRRALRFAGLTACFVAFFLSFCDAPAWCQKAGQTTQAQRRRAKTPRTAKHSSSRIAKRSARAGLGVARAALVPYSLESLTGRGPGAAPIRRPLQAARASRKNARGNTARGNTARGNTARGNTARGGSNPRKTQGANLSSAKRARLTGPATWRASGRALWHALLLTQALALALAGVVLVMTERAHGQAQNRTPRRRWLRARFPRFNRDAGVPATGWAHETLLHSARVERMRAALPPLWPLALGAARWALLAAFLMPAVALWASVSRLLPKFGVTANTLLVAAGVAGLALLLARWRARNIGTFALLLCSGVSVATMVLALGRDALMRGAAARAAQAGGVPTGDAGSWLDRSLLGWGAMSSGAETFGPARTLWSGAHLSAPDAGYLVGASLVCAAAVVMGAQMSRRELFDAPPLEVRHVHPLDAPLPAVARAQLRLLAFWVAVAVVLAVRPLGGAPAAAALLALAGALCLWGWRCKVLRPKQIAVALLGAALAGALAWTLWTATGENGVREALREALRFPASWPAAMRAAPELWSRRLAANAEFCGGALALLGAALFLLRRQPAHLWSNLGHAPAWGWVLGPPPRWAWPCCRPFFLCGWKERERLLVSGYW